MGQLRTGKAKGPNPVNKAAIPDRAVGGLDLVAPLVVAIMKALDDPAAMAELSMTVLIGDLQVRRVTGAMGPLTPQEIQAQAGAALGQFVRLF